MASNINCARLTCWPSHCPISIHSEVVHRSMHRDRRTWPD